MLDKNPAQTFEAHRWLIALVIKDAGAGRDSAKFNRQIGIYQHQIKAALKNFIPQGAKGALVEMTPPPVIYEETLAYYFFRYEAHCVYSKDFGVGADMPTPPNKPF